MSGQNESGAALETEGWNGWNDALDAMIDRLTSAAKALAERANESRLDPPEAKRLMSKREGVLLALDLARGLRR